MHLKMQKKKTVSKILSFYWSFHFILNALQMLKIANLEFPQSRNIHNRNYWCNHNLIVLEFWVLLFIPWQKLRNEYAKDIILNRL